MVKRRKNEEKPLETTLKIKHGEKNIVKNVRSAEQFLALANAGYANKG